MAVVGPWKRFGVDNPSSGIEEAFLVNGDLIGALQQIEREKGIPAETLISAIEVALVSAYRRNFGSSSNVRARIDRETGEVRVFARKRVSEDLKDPKDEIAVEKARALDPSVKVGDEVDVEVTPKDFGRIAAQTAKQVVVQRIREAERGMIFEEYSGREGDIVTGIVHRVEHRNIILDLGRAEAVLPPQEQVEREFLRQGERVKLYIVEVKKTTKGPVIIVSRTHPGLVKRLFELEVPEIHDGIVEIKGIAREPGSRTKVAVSSRDQSVDAVGACVGPKGMRVQAIVSELRGEKVDIIRWDPSPEVLVAAALSPAKVSLVRLNEKNRVARVVVPDDQLSLAIGKEGQNARLAAKLSGWKIDIRSESQMAAEATGSEAAGAAGETVSPGRAE